jgi:hypothetical protein
MLFKKERNDLFGAIIAGGLQPTDFSEVNGDTYMLTYKKSRFIMTIVQVQGGYKTSSFPTVEEYSSGYVYEWEGCVKYCNAWAEFIKVENDTPDLWAEAQTNAKLFTLNPSVPNEMFNAAELRQLEGQVRLLLSGLASLALPAHAEKVLIDTINEIPEKASRFSKKELEGWFMGAFISQVTNLALSPEHVAAIGHLLKTTFMGLLQIH